MSKHVITQPVKVRVLLLKSAAADVECVRLALLQAGEMPFEIKWDGNLPCALESAELGVLDILVTGKVSAAALVRSIRFAIQRQQYITAASQYLMQLEALGSSQASNIEPPSNALVCASGPQALVSDNLKAAEKQLRRVFKAFQLLDLHIRHALTADGIHLSSLPMKLGS